MFNFRLGLLALFSLLLLSGLAYSANLTMYYFYGSGCPHCQLAEPFVYGLEQNYSSFLKVESFEVWYSPSNAELFENFSKAYGISQPSTPTFFIGDDYVQGWVSEEVTGQKLNSMILACRDGSCPDSWEIVTGEFKPVDDSVNPDELVFNIPLFGKVDLRSSPLLVLALVIGLLDGFNPCAMWVLIYLISMLAIEKDRKKMWLIAGTFLFASAVMYYLILTSWLNVFLFLGYLEITRIIIGVIAVVAGVYALNESMKKGEACQVVPAAERKKIMHRIQELTKPSIVPATLLGIVILAFSVNLIEFVCSAGFPALFTRILAESHLSFFEYQFYIFAYLLMFMIDDILIFSMAIITLSNYNDTGEKYAKISHVIGGLLMLILGIILLFFPKFLQF